MALITDADELWRMVPPEEKLTILNRAHGSGVYAAIVVILVGAAFAIGLHQVWFFWGAFLVAPVVFQFTAGRTWRGLRPALMLEFLAARSAARRFAFAANAKDLSLQLMFRGNMQEVLVPEDVDAQMQSMVDKVKETEVWIALFNDAVVMISEDLGGARAQFAQVVTPKFELEVENGEGGDYSADKVLNLAYTHKVLGHRKVRITSPHAAAMVVFEKLLARRLNDLRAAEDASQKLIASNSGRSSGGDDVGDAADSY